METNRTWYVAECTPKLIEVSGGSYEAVVDKQRLGAVVTSSREDAIRLAKTQWPDKTIEVTRGSQG